MPTAHVKVATALEDVPDFLVLVHVPGIDCRSDYTMQSGGAVVDIGASLVIEVLDL
jgi:hypothetical protein